MIFLSQRFFQKTNEQIRPYYLLTCFCSFLEESEDTKKTLLGKIANRFDHLT